MAHPTHLLHLLLLAAAAAAAAGAPPDAPRAAQRLPPLPLSTRGRQIIDAAGGRARLRCASWSGGQESWYAPSGLWAQHRSVIVKKAAAAGLNCLRLVWSLESVLKPSVNGSGLVPAAALKANPDLIGKSPLQVLDAVIKAANDEGLMVILDNHSSDAMWCCDLQDGNGLWYTAKWSEAQWLEGWSTVAQRYANVSGVIGTGLRNEPRPARIGGRFHMPTWGTGGRASDLAAAYERAAAVVLAARPTYLIFAQGLMAGRDLRLVRGRPLVLRAGGPKGNIVTNQLVYEVHEYPWLWGGFNFTNYKGYAARLDGAWGYIATSGRAPLWLGEFGVAHDAKGINSPWWKALTRYVKERGLDWSYWPLDGQQGPSRSLGAEETYGLLNTSWDGWAYEPLVTELQALM